MEGFGFAPGDKNHFFHELHRVPFMHDDVLLWFLVLLKTVSLIIVGVGG